MCIEDEGINLFGEILTFSLIEIMYLFRFIDMSNLRRELKLVDGQKKNGNKTPSPFNYVN